MSSKVEKLLETGRDLKDFSYVWQSITCKKAGCRRCPHGPYLYARWKESGKVRAIYIGRTIPEELKPYLPVST